MIVGINKNIKERKTRKIRTDWRNEKLNHKWGEIEIRLNLIKRHNLIRIW